MTETEKLSGVIATAMHKATVPFLEKMAHIQGQLDGCLRLIDALEKRAMTPGPVGAVGAPGRDGVDGAKGLDGLRGQDGAVGPQGLPGMSVVGLAGEKGDPGARGPEGPQGREGLAGRDGLNGKDGVDGFDGKHGRDGLQGPQGEKGLDGKDGLVGARGEKGQPGEVDRVWLDAADVRFATVDAKLAKILAPVPSLSSEEMATNFTALLRNELATLGEATPLRVQKRVIRDAHGSIERVVEEPAI